MSEPDVSVIIPTYRREQQVVEAVRSALSEQSISIEVLVLDDTSEGSAEEGVRTIGDPRIHYHRQLAPSRGRPAMVRNEGMRHARGRYLYFLDDDDHVMPGALSALSSALDQAPRCAVAYGTVTPFGKDPAVVASYARWFDWAARISRRLSGSKWLTTGTILFRGTLIINSACMIRRTCARELNGYDADIPVYEDVDFHMRGIRRWGHLFVDRPVLHYRTGAPSLIHDLQGDTKPIHDSYRIIHRKYKETYGAVDYRALQAACKALPLRVQLKSARMPLRWIACQVSGWAKRPTVRSMARAREARWTPTNCTPVDTPAAKAARLASITVSASPPVRATTGPQP